MVSAGFDSRAGGPLGRFTLSDQDFADLTTLIQRLNGHFCHGLLG